MVLVPTRRRTRRRTSRVKRGVSSKDYYLHIKLDGWRNAYASPDVIPFEGRGRKPTAELSENQYLGFLHQLRGIASLGWRYPRLADYRNVSGKIFGLETIGTIGTAGTIGTGFFLGVRAQRDFPVRRDGGPLSPQVKRKILSDNPRRFYLDLKNSSLP